MKNEIFEKVGEIILATNIRSAKENKKIATKAKQDNSKRAIEIVAILAYIINQKAEQGDTHLDLYWKKDKPLPYGISAEDWENCAEFIRDVFTSLGYSYHPSWLLNSNKITWVRISWER